MPCCSPGTAAIRRRRQSMDGAPNRSQSMFDEPSTRRLFALRFAAAATAKAGYTST